MKRHHVLGLAFLAVFAFSAVLAASASAEITLLAEWLNNGVAIITLTATDTEGLLTLINPTGLGTARVACEGILDGSVGPNGEDEITEVLNLLAEKIGGELVGLSLICLTENATILCGAVASSVEVWPDNLPWLTNAFLMEDGSFLDHLFASGTLEPGYHMLCVATGAENLCAGLETSFLRNRVGGIEDEFVEGAEIQVCTVGTTETPLGSGIILPTNGGTLTMSSE